MDKSKLHSLIRETLDEVKSRNVRNQLKAKIKHIILEVLEDDSKKDEKTIEEILSDLEKDVKKINSKATVTKDDAGNVNIGNFDPHTVSIRHMGGDLFDVVYFKDSSDRTKKNAIHFEDVRKFIKEVLTSKDENYVDSAFSKVVENSKDKQSGKKSPTGQETDEKVIDAVKKESDLPDAPMKEVGDKIKKQSDFPVKGKKRKYVYPKQKDDRLTVKFE